MTPTNGAFSYDAGRKRAKVRVYAGLDPITGKQRVRSKTWPSPNATTAKRESHKVIARLQAEAADSRDRAGTVAGYALEWEQTMIAERKATATLYRMRSIVQAIVDDLGHKRLDELTVRDVERWYTHLRTENVGQGKVERFRSESTVHHYHRILAQILSAAERQDMLAVAPTRRAKPPKRPKPKPRPPDTATLIALLGSAERGLRIAATLAAQLGLRRGELAGLQWTDVVDGVLHVQRSVVDVPGHAVSFKPPKTDESVRQLKLEDEQLLDLALWRTTCEAAAAEVGGKLADDAVLFPNLTASPDGRVPRRPTWLSQAWAAHCKAQGVHVRFHDLRHWAATNLVASGMPITNVAKQLGHARTSTTLDVYSGTSDRNDRAAAVLGALLSGEGVDAKRPPPRP